MSLWIGVMFLVLIFLLLLGYPVALTLGAVALLFGSIFLGFAFFDLLPLNIWGVMTNFSLLAVPLFIFMGVILDKSGLAEELLETMALLFGRLRGGLALSVVFVGALLAATTGVVGATVVTMGIIALPTMLKHAYSPQLASGTIAASGTLGQIIPPSIILILLGDVMGVPVGRLFMAAVIPGLLLVVLFCIYLGGVAWFFPQSAPALKQDKSNHLFTRVIFSLLPPLVLVIAVLGSIFFGIASPTESAAVGALGAMCLAGSHRKLTMAHLKDSMRLTTQLTSMVFLILIGAYAFGLVFRGMGGDILVLELMTNLPGGIWGFLLLSMLLVFVLGFFLDFLQICFIVVPILSPIAQHMQVDLLWFAILIAINLQTSFLTPPFGFSLFYLKAVAPPAVNIHHIYRGIIPFVILQIIGLLILITFPDFVLWLPDIMDRMHGLK
ncbi:MAG: TRAP transporter large permease subunit [Gammaproteobacteria bacterium]|nr:TRAP transporter large permease subunit [Gammaproteobacteria bacterium]NIN62441.1 TRAP transporter large permease subunit [Gammaproteobacteria bacterium]NIO63036.1 TRAP transporter large permease subunit [Gammaproteobacteria bacterium]NIP49017.1 TRAP transporter large permease subunit [Gammaproteobacteria bacterium]NIQ09473.1 TRAP transporter large permease subunit [Gammaproteobacteria bacterium]